MIALKQEDKLIPVMFNRIHKRRKPPQNEQELRQIFIDEGVDAAFNGFAINSMIR